MKPSTRTLWAMGAVVAFGALLYWFNIPATLQNGVTETTALNWLGVLVTVLSLCVTFFLAIMALDAYAYVATLRTFEERHIALERSISDNAEWHITLVDSISNYSKDVLELTSKYLTGLGLPEDDKDIFLLKLTALRSKLEISALPKSDRQSFEKVVSHLLVLVQVGGRANLDFCLMILKDVPNSLESYHLVGVVLKKRADLDRK